MNLLEKITALISKEPLDRKTKLLSGISSFFLAAIFAFISYIYMSKGTNISKKYLLVSLVIFFISSIFLFFINNIIIIPKIFLTNINQRFILIVVIIIFINLINFGVPNTYFFLPVSQVDVTYIPYVIDETTDCSVVIDGISIGGNRWVSFDDVENQNVMGERVRDDYIIKGCDTSKIQLTGKFSNEIILDSQINPNGGEILISLPGDYKIKRSIEDGGKDVILKEEIPFGWVSKFLLEFLPNILFAIGLSYIIFVVLLLVRFYQIFEFPFTKNLIFSEKIQPNNLSHQRIKFDKKQMIALAICIILSALSITIVSASSPLNPVNASVDNNAFFTLGRSMMNGKVPYRDLYENNGPYTHFLFGIASLISNSTFLGVYTIEVLFFSAFLYISYKITSLFVNSNYAIVLIPVLAFSTVNLVSFAGGGHVEEFCLPLLSLSLYHHIKYFKQIYPNPFPKKWFLLNGVIAGCVLWSKYSLLGFWFGWMASQFFILLSIRQFRQAFRGAFIFLCGMVLATIPWVMYFGINKSIGDWINVYILNTFLFYRRNFTFAELINYLIRYVKENFDLHPIYYTVMLFGIGIFTLSEHLIKDLLHRISFFLCAVLLFVGVYGGGRAHWYSPFIFSPYIIFGLLSLLLVLGKIGKIYFPRESLVLVLIITLISISSTLHFYPPQYLMGIKKEDTVQFKYASIINQTDNPTLLNYDCLDGGFYTVTGIIPNIKYFMTYNIPHSLFPEIKNEQNRYIKEKVVDYVIVYLPSYDEHAVFPYPNLLQNYDLIEVEGISKGYLLFRNKDIQQ